MNFDSIINEALKQGLSVSDIAASINSSLDKAYKQEEDKKTADAEAAKRAEKQAYLAQLIELCRSGNYSYDVAAAHATMAVSVANKDWSLKQLKNYYNSVFNSCVEAEKIIAKNDGDIEFSSVSIGNLANSVTTNDDNKVSVSNNFFDDWIKRFPF